MKKVTKVEVAYSGLNDALLRLFRDWRPRPLKTELEYRNALFEYLREAFPEDSRVEKEYRHNGTTSDLYLRWKGMLGGATEVFFELKRNLRKKVEFDRLVGQIEGLNPKDNIIFVVLLGELDPALVARLKERYAEMLESSFLGGTQMALIEVP